MAKTPLNFDKRFRALDPTGLDAPLTLTTRDDQTLWSKLSGVIPGLAFCAALFILAVVFLPAQH